MAKQKRGVAEYVQNLVIRGVIRLALTLPYGARVRFMGWVMSAVVAPIAGWRTRVRNNLNLVLPDMPAD